MPGYGMKSMKPKKKVALPKRGQRTATNKKKPTRPGGQRGY